MSIAIAAAGTGGHVYPALAVASALVEQGLDPERIVFVGGDRLEAKAVPAAGFPFEQFDLFGLRRSLSLKNLRIPAALHRNARAMESTLRRRGSRVVLCMGGYATVPAAMAAHRARIPLFVQEQNAVPGLATRFASRRAVAAFIGLPGPADRLPRATLTGNPVRAELARFDRAVLAGRARQRYGLSDGGLVLGVLGGSLGARVLNQAVPRIVAGWDGGPLSVVHLAGGEVESVRRAAAGSRLVWRCLPFEDQMEFFYAAVDLVLCRAGAMTVSELAATATPAVLVPLQRVGQQHNAASLEGAGGAVVVAEGAVGGLPEVISRLMGDHEGRAAMAVRARAVAHPEAAALIAARLLEVALG
jgi:UDP-N-acetylglucosamine--N-acetylmuramyl-(pentapeptide) pyrophosphoryl-undecaprenol N-acetylglucosamine transferase